MENKMIYLKPEMTVVLSEEDIICNSQGDNDADSGLEVLNF